MNAAKDHFFNAKRRHLETLRVAYEDNYAQKYALLQRAEAIKSSNQWRDSTEEMNELMDEWKKIGQVPKEHSNTMWEQFIGARKYFFERKDADREKRKENYEKQIQSRFDQKRTFIQKLEEELKEEKEKFDDFKLALENVTPGNKEEELRTHLNKLIELSDGKISQKEKKIEEVTQQLTEMESKKSIIEKPAEKEKQQ